MSKTQFYTDFENKYAEREFDPSETMKWLRIQPMLPMCWGMRNSKNLFNKGLLFTVNGFLHKGFVLITLAWNDTYTIRLFNSKYNQVGEAHEGIYCDMLCEYIDSIVETKR